MAKKSPKDYYNILGVSYTATEQEIKSAYRSLARKYHPDVNQGNKLSEEKFKEIGQAYSILSNEKQRYLLDIALGIKTLESEKKTPPKTDQTDSKTTTRATTKTTKTKKATENKAKPSKDSNFTEAFSDLFESILKSTTNNPKTASQKNTTPRFTTEPPPVKQEKNIYSDLGKKPKTSSPAEKGDDISLDVYLPAEQAIKGAVRTVNILHTDPCNKCNSTGILAGSQCRTCEGKGEKITHKKLDFIVPAGIKNGSKVRIAKEGNKNPNNAERGDLYLTIKIYNPNNFQIDGNNVMSEVTLAPHEAVLGAEIQVLSIDGFIKMKIPPETQADQKFRLVGQGLPNSSGERGNHFVKIKIDVPTNISQREKELYEEIARISKFNPREYIE